MPCFHPTLVCHRWDHTGPSLPHAHNRLRYNPAVIRLPGLHRKISHLTKQDQRLEMHTLVDALSGHFPDPHIRTPIYLWDKILQTHSQLGDIIPNQSYHRKQPLRRLRYCSHYKTKWSDKDCPGGSRNCHLDHLSLDMRNPGSRDHDCGCNVQIPCTN